MAVISTPESVGGAEHNALVAKFCAVTTTLRSIVQAGPTQVRATKVSYSWSIASLYFFSDVSPH